MHPSRFDDGPGVAALCEHSSGSSIVPRQSNNILFWGKFEHLFSVAMRNFLFVDRTDRDLLKKRSSLIPRNKGIINRVHDAICPYDLQGEQERWQGKHSTGGHIHLLKKVVRDRPLQMFCGWRYRLIHASQVEGDHFAPVAENELETGIAIKDAAQDHAQRMDACLHMPHPTEGRKAGTDNRIKASIVGILHDFGWEGRMQVDGNIQSNGRFENGMK